MRAPDWLTARPIAHRGLHDAARGIIENTRSSVKAAAAQNFGIEVDLQITADGEAVVHHDDSLGRLTQGAARLRDMTADALRAVPFLNTADKMMTLGDLCAEVGGRVPLVLELKSHFDGDIRLVTRAAEVLKTYEGPAAIMSFDPDLVLAARRHAPQLVRGIVAESHYDDGEWTALTPQQRRRMTFLRHAFSTCPHFVAYWVRDLPAPAPWIARHVFGCPLLTWTVRTPEQVAHARRHADQMIFEGFVPSP